MRITADTANLTCLFDDCGKSSVHNNLVNATSFDCPHCKRKNVVGPEVASVGSVTAKEVTILGDLTVTEFNFD